MKDEWKTFIDKLTIPTEFLHRDEFLRKLKSHPHNIGDVKFPAVFLDKGGKISLLITHNEINECKTLKDLMNLITKKLTRITSEKLQLGNCQSFAFMILRSTKEIADMTTHWSWDITL